MTPIEYLSYYRSGKLPDTVTGLCGRILRGKTPQDFEKLSDDPNRQIVYLTDSDGLKSLIGKSGYDQLVAIGHHPDYIAKCVGEGKTYKLTVFPESAAICADWDGMFELVRQIYPTVYPYCKKYRHELKTWPFAKIERLAGYKFKEHDDPSDPKFMSLENFEKSSKGLVHVRSFFYCAIHVRELYSGDGYTYDENGNRGVKEYLLPNVKITDIPGALLEDMIVEIP